IAAQLRLSEAETLALLKRLRDAGVIRRIAAVPNHYRLGYRHNGMTVWDVADERIERLGRLVGGLSFVSHCYRRPR
ncbi:Lrp/AsnC family transcriptional regulator, partial [Rhizobium leguminosarum]